MEYKFMSVWVRSQKKKHKERGGGVAAVGEGRKRRKRKKEEKKEGQPWRGGFGLGWPEQNSSASAHTERPMSNIQTTTTGQRGAVQGTAAPQKQRFVKQSKK